MARQTISQKYAKRAAKLEAAQRTARSRARSLMRLGLQEAVDTELYERTP